MMLNLRSPLPVRMADSTRARLPLATVLSSSILIAMVLSTSATAGELDARRLKDEPGSLPETALPAEGAGQLSLIRGALEQGQRGGNLEDVFLIRIVDVEGFSARSTRPAGAPPLQTHLWLFDVCGRPILGNLVDPLAMPGSGGARLLPQATDGSGAAVVEPGLYLLAISAGFDGGAGRVPQSVGGALFTITTPTEISGPDGPGGNLNLAMWIGSGTVGEYKIELTGCAFLGSGVGDLDGSGAVDGADLGLLLAEWGAVDGVASQLADLNDDGVVDGSDLGLLLAYWGPSVMPSHCGDQQAGECTDPASLPHCNDACCCTQVCNLDPRCCVVMWDAICAAIAVDVCGG